MLSVLSIMRAEASVFETDLHSGKVPKIHQMHAILAAEGEINGKRWCEEAELHRKLNSTASEH